MITNLERYADRHPRAVDVATGLALVACAALGAALSTPGTDAPDEQWPAVVLAAVSCLALVNGRTHPRAALIVVAAGTVATSVLNYLLTPLLLAPVMMALYWLAAMTDNRTTRVYGLPTVAALVLTSALNDPTDISVTLRVLGPVLWLLLPLAAGSSTRARRAYTEAVQARAEHAERTREEEARLRVTEERVRIARELHDVVAHHLALANAQAGTAAHLALASPQQSKKILTDLTGTTSSALRELKATVGLLRQTGDPDSDPLKPSPGLDRLPELISACASAGLDVTLTTEGEPLPLSPGVDLTAFRIVQEALTNITKHAATEAAHIRLAYSDARVIITVTNDAPATAPAPALTASGGGRGFGLMGMRERAHSVGGELRAGPRPDGGFEVTTALPLHPQARDGRGQPFTPV
ncbi:sensor histidine kinase [Streptomyces spongiae]|uniref:histidine kinase n=1 Tax=Streptomyces spongiae TaxID=565072 RepID=A0A5N8XHF8_9ACTN|nr:histidine kinase [Streptomyces spongiae]MPY58892.1 sensor histidine kinase [Streptomyces spongiae]